MDLVQIKIEKDDNSISYIKIIRAFDKSVSISDIKNKIDCNDFIYSFYLEARDWMYIEGMTEYKWHSEFYNMLIQLEASGAALEIYIDGRKESMLLLSNWINTIKEISDDCDEYPD